MAVVYSSMPHHDTLPTLKTQKCRLHREESGSSATSSKYGGVKKIESVTQSELNSNDLNSPLSDETQCSDRTNGHLIMFHTEAEPTHTDSVITSTETPIDDEKTPVQRKLANTDNSNCGDLELAKHNRVPFFCFKALFFLQ
ncbi:hypothetical protein HID58_074749 [Brassica napus]|uniref:Uncharacterized protein n=1 Tax=Brassica napus TaxID=3708 RepID=A0ABQ7YHX1_BRANA|nr:hypothetical protein HID58_074749 [Brassica napus]